MVVMRPDKGDKRNHGQVRSGQVRSISKTLGIILEGEFDPKCCHKITVD